jgi:hypothetical protein
MQKLKFIFTIIHYAKKAKQAILLIGAFGAAIDAFTNYLESHGFQDKTGITDGE